MNMNRRLKAQAVVLRKNLELWVKEQKLLEPGQVLVVSVGVEIVTKPRVEIKVEPISSRKTPETTGLTFEDWETIQSLAYRTHTNSSQLLVLMREKGANTIHTVEIQRGMRPSVRNVDTVIGATNALLKKKGLPYRIKRKADERGNNSTGGCRYLMYKLLTKKG